MVAKGKTPYFIVFPSSFCFLLECRSGNRDKEKNQDPGWTSRIRNTGN